MGGGGRGRLCGVFGGDDPYMRIISVSHAALSPPTHWQGQWSWWTALTGSRDSRGCLGSLLGR